MSTSDAARYRWLRENAGKWRVLPDPIEWKRPDGTRFRPLVAFAVRGTAIYGCTLDEAVDYAMQMYPTPAPPGSGGNIPEN